MSNLNSNYRRCSFCRNHGHNIKSCNNIELLKFKKTIIEMRNNYILEPAVFSQLINELPVNLICALAVRECNILARNASRNECITAIYNKYMRNAILRLNEINSSNTNYSENELTEINNQINNYTNSNNNLTNDTNNHLTNDTDNESNNEYDNDLISVSSSSDTESDVEDESIITWQIDRTGNYEYLNKQNTCIYSITKTLNIDTTTFNNPSNYTKCGICYEEKLKEVFIQLQCNHEFCQDCIYQQLNIKKATCAFCREKMEHFNIRSQETNDFISTILI